MLSLLLKAIQAHLNIILHHHTPCLTCNSSRCVSVRSSQPPLPPASPPPTATQRPLPSLPQRPSLTANRSAYQACTDAASNTSCSDDACSCTATMAEISCVNLACPNEAVPASISEQEVKYCYSGADGGVDRTLAPLVGLIAGAVAVFVWL